MFGFSESPVLTVGRMLSWIGLHLGRLRMSWSGSSLLAVVRTYLWGLLLFAGVAWLAVGWSVLRLTPTDVVSVAGLVVLFGALTEVVRACAGTRTWWLNAGMAVLFAVTGIVLLAEPDTAYTAPAALVGWYLMVRGAVDIAVAMMARESDRIWGLVMVVGVLQAGLGFFAASPLARSADLAVTALGALGLLRGVADLVTALRVRESSAVSSDVLELSPERAEGLTGYTAGLTDYGSAPAPARSKPRHRASARPSSGSVVSAGSGADDSMWPDGPAATLAAAGGGTAADAVPGVSAAGGMAAAGYVAADVPERATDTFHEEVLRTTADLDAMLALAGVTGAGVGAHLDDFDAPVVPDSLEGVDMPGAAQPSGATAVEAGADSDGGPPILDPSARATQGAAGVDEASIIAGIRRIN